MSKLRTFIGQLALKRMIVIIIAVVLPLVIVIKERTSSLPQQSICNAPLFQPVRFSSSQQEGSLFYVISDSTSFQNPTIAAFRTNAEQRVWQRTFLAGGGGATRLVVADGIVYALSSTTSFSWLVALDAQTGQQLWQYSEAGSDDMAICENRLFLLNSSSLHVFENKTGALLWGYSKDEELAPTIVATKETVYLVGTPRYRGNTPLPTIVHALNLLNGSERWSVPLPADKLLITRTTVTLTEQAVYILRMSLQDPGQLVALRIQDGKQLWRIVDPPYDNVLMASHGILYLSGYQRLDALHASSGKLLWSQQVENITSFSGSPEQGIYGFGVAGDRFCSLDMSKGTVHWCFQQDLSEWDATSFFVDKNTVYLISQNHQKLYILDTQSGQERKQFESKHNGLNLLSAVAEL